MEFDTSKDRVTLSSGRTAYCYGTSVHPDDDGELSYGADGGIDWDRKEPLTQSERDEIAGHMIEKWTQWARGGNG